MHAHFDCFSGISGDMTLAAFVNLGVPVSYLTDFSDTISKKWVEEFGVPA